MGARHRSLLRQSLVYSSYDEVPDEFYIRMNFYFKSFHTTKPKVSIVVLANGSGIGLISTLASLAKQRTSYATEFIVVDNSYSCPVKKMIERIGVKSLTGKYNSEEQARQVGIEAAKGEYVLLSKAGNIHQPYWSVSMLEHLMMDGVAGVFGPYRQQCNSRSSWFKSRMEDWGRAFLDHMREIKPPDNPLSQWNFGLLRALGDKAGPRLKNDSWPQVLGEYGDLLWVRDAEAKVLSKPLG